MGEESHDGTMTNMEVGDIQDDVPFLYGEEVTVPALEAGTRAALSGDTFVTGDIITTWYTMRAVDNNAGITPTYRVWKVTGTPDYDASRYDGPYSGGSVNFSSISIIDISRVTT